jgi:hypothetical protein
MQLILSSFYSNQLIDIQYNVIKNGLESSALLSGTEQQNAWKISKDELANNLKPGTIFFSFIQCLPAGFILSMLSAYLFKKE